MCSRTTLVHSDYLGLSGPFNPSETAWLWWRLSNQFHILCGLTLAPGYADGHLNIYYFKRPFIYGAYYIYFFDKALIYGVFWPPI